MRGICIAALIVCALESCSSGSGGVSAGGAAQPTAATTATSDTAASTTATTSLAQPASGPLVVPQTFKESCAVLNSGPVIATLSDAITGIFDPAAAVDARQDVTFAAQQLRLLEPQAGAIDVAAIEGVAKALDQLAGASDDDLANALDGLVPQLERLDSQMQEQCAHA